LTGIETNENNDAATARLALRPMFSHVWRRNGHDVREACSHCNRQMRIALLILTFFAPTFFALTVSADERSSAKGVEDSPPVPLLPADGGPRRWQVKTGRRPEMREAPADDADISVRLDAGVVLSNRGCEKIKGRVWCDVSTLRMTQRGHVPADALEPAIGPDGTIPVGVDDSSTRARAGRFDAEATTPCAQERGQVMGKCTAGAARGTGGDATIVVSFANGFTRTLTFVHGEFVLASATMSGTGSDNDWREANGLYMIRVDDQRYELPAKLVFGP